MTALLWLPGSRLVVGSSGGSIVALQLLQPAPASPGPAEAAGVSTPAALACSLATLAVEDGQAAGGGGGCAAGEAGEAPPPADEGQAPDGPPAASGGGSPASVAAAEAAAAAAAAALAGPRSNSPTRSSNSISSQQAGPSTPRAVSGSGQDTQAVQYEPAAAAGPSVVPQHSGADTQDTVPAVPHGPPDQPAQQQGLAMAPPTSASRQNSSSSGGSGQPARRLRGARGSGASRGGGGAAEGAAPGGGPSGSTGFSASLMHHIQAIRDNPPQGGHASRLDQPQLAGWGLGESRTGRQQAAWLHTLLPSTCCSTLFNPPPRLDTSACLATPL